jgi:hypothetical protein
MMQMNGLYVFSGYYIDSLIPVCIQFSGFDELKALLSAEFRKVMQE